MDSKIKVQGFKAAAVKSGIRGRDRLDLGLICCDCTAVAAGVFTTNLVKAAPVLLDMERLEDGRARAILVNSGIANACSGQPGMDAARTTSAMVASELGIDDSEVLVASTGVIGDSLDLGCFEKGIPAAAAILADDGLGDVARAIMTTDTVSKTAVREATIGGVPVKLVGVAKGAGMIKPNMATMLAFVLTDVVVGAELLRRMLLQGVERSFNRVDVDGDTSTNDTVLVLANGLAANKPLDNDQEAAELFQDVLNDLLTDLALQVVKDGEGATKLVTVKVVGASDDREAKLAAETVADSKLVKTAFFGEDANWGRIIAALGRSGASFDPAKVDISFDGVLMVKNGQGCGKDVEVVATKVLRQPEFTVNIDLKNGESAYHCYTCDLSVDYVKINADYRS